MKAAKCILATSFFLGYSSIFSQAFAQSISQQLQSNFEAIDGPKGDIPNLISAMSSFIGYKNKGDGVRGAISEAQSIIPKLNQAQQDGAMSQRKIQEIVDDINSMIRKITQGQAKGRQWKGHSLAPLGKKFDNVGTDQTRARSFLGQFEAMPNIKPGFKQRAAGNIGQDLSLIGKRQQALQDCDGAVNVAETQTLDPISQDFRKFTEGRQSDPLSYLVPSLPNICGAISSSNTSENKTVISNCKEALNQFIESAKDSVNNIKKMRSGLQEEGNTLQKKCPPALFK